MEFNKTLLTIADRLFERTQGAQVFRDGAFHLCQAYQNEIVGKTEYIDLYKLLVSSTSRLIMYELITVGSKFADAPNEKTPVDMTKIIEDKTEYVKKINQILDKIEEGQWL